MRTNETVNFVEQIVCLENILKNGRLFSGRTIAIVINLLESLVACHVLQDEGQKEHLLNLYHETLELVDEELQEEQLEVEKAW